MDDIEYMVKRDEEGLMDSPEGKSEIVLAETDELVKVINAKFPIALDKNFGGNEKLLKILKDMKGYLNDKGL